MNCDTPLDYALFQLSPRRTRCELFVSGDGKTEKLASGFLKPFVTHLKFAEEQASHAVHLIKLAVVSRKNVATWFNKGTVERFVRFVSTPEVLELVNTFGAEMSQLEGARKIYSQGAGEQFSGESAMKSAAAADATKKELLRAIDVRLIAVRQDLATACARASAAGFSLQSVSELLLFADQFGAFRLSEACKKFLSLHEQRPELIDHQQLVPSPAINPQWKSFNDANIRSSSGSDMSIDEPEVEHTGTTARLATSDCSDAHARSLSTHQQKQTSVSEPVSATSEQLKPHPHHFIEKVVEKVEEVPAPRAASSAEPVQQAAGGSRRLSVQDRINLFESKQKEQSANANNGGGSSGGFIVSKLAGARGEHHRNPSDVSVEKFVLRRWSGASDMSIDLNSNSSSNEHKESVSASGTPTSAVNSQLQTSSRNAENESSGLIESSKSHTQLSIKNSLVEATSAFLSSHDNDRILSKGETQTRDVVPIESFASSSGEPPGLNEEKEQAHTWTHSMDGLSGSGLGNPVVYQSTPKGFSNSWEGTGSGELAATQTNSRPLLEESVNVETVSQFPSRGDPVVVMPTEPNQGSFLAHPRDRIEADVIAVKAQVASATRLRAFAIKREDAGSKSKGASDSQIQFKASSGKVEDISVKAGCASPQIHGRTYVEHEESKQKTPVAPQVSFKDFSTETKQGSDSQGLRFSGKTSGNNQKKNLHERRDEIVPVGGCNSLISRSRKVKKSTEAPPSSSSSIEEFHTERTDKSNYELNGVLQMKADELEKLFAEHKLRVYGDQVAYTQRSKTFDDHASKSVDNEPALSPTKQMPEKSLHGQFSSNAVEFDSDVFLRKVDNFDISDGKLQKIGNHTPSDDSRGKLYNKYMQKRDAKLREECGSKRAQKEAKMKAMYDSLELSQAEMKARFSEFSGGQNLTHAHLRAEKMRCFNSHSTLKIKDQTSGILTGVGDDEQELSKSSGNQSKKLLSNRTLPSNSRASNSPTPKHSVKSANFSSLRHRAQAENPVALSVPNFSDFKNENIKPSMLLSNTTSGQARSLDRSKSSVGDAEIVKEDRSLRSNSMRKSSGTPSELKDLSSLNSEEPSNKVQIRGESKQYLKKGNGAYHGSGAVLGKLKTTIVPEELTDREKPEETVNQLEDLPDMINDDVDFERTSEGNNLIMDLTHYDGLKSRQGQESCETETENGDDMKPLSHREDSIFFSSKFISARDAQDSPEESSGSWNSHVHHLLAYTQEASDIEASMDSPTDSPASWSFHPLNQMMDSDAARLRKKWGSAQIPVIAESSSLQSRRDVPKGFKRLLKFGRKSRGIDYLVNDWVSASTASEGDDDTEDGRDLVPRPSDDFRKSRMGYSIPAYDGFNEGDIFPDQASLCSSIPNPSANFRMSDDHLSGSSLKAPRSFFSLSSFRSKASDSKPR